MKLNNKKTIYYVYCLVNKINNKLYVGYSENPEQRFKGHCANNKWKINKAIKKYGANNFEIKLLFDTFSKEEACETEKHYIQKFKTLNRESGYNLSAGGMGGNVMAGASEENKINKKNKISNSLKNRKITWGDKISLKRKGYTTYIILKTGETKCLHKDDPLVLRGEAVGLTKGIKKISKVIFPKEESDFIINHYLSGLSAYKIVKPFIKRFNKNITRSKIGNYIYMSLIRV
jgi:group I intron endonuclease